MPLASNQIIYEKTLDKKKKQNVRNVFKPPMPTTNAQLPIPTVQMPRDDSRPAPNQIS